MGSSWADLKPQKSVFLRYHFLSFYTTATNHFSIGLWRVMKSDFYMTSGNDQLSGWTEKKLQSTSQSQTCTKNRSWSLFGGLLPVWSAQLSESCWNHYIWEVCSANWWDSLKTAMPVASTGQQKEPKSSPWKCPIAHCIANTSIAERIGLPSSTDVFELSYNDLKFTVQNRNYVGTNRLPAFRVLVCCGWFEGRSPPKKVHLPPGAELASFFFFFFLWNL